MQTAMLDPVSPSAPVSVAPEGGLRPREYIAFRSQGQDFCIDILAVREIRGWTRGAMLPHAPHYVEGVINLRGAIVPIYDLAAKLGLPRIAVHERNVIIVTVIGKRVVGLLVETVTDIFSAAPETMRPVPDLARDETHAALSGMIVESDRLLRIIDLNALFPSSGDAG